MTAVASRPILQLREMTDRDLSAVVAIEQAAYPRPAWSRETFAEELRRDDRCYLVAVLDGEVVGFAGALVAADEAQILTVAVAPRQQRRGVGRGLVAALLEAVEARGAGSVTLEVRTSNLPAQNLYRQLGFVPAGERPGYYQDGEDALLMWKV